MIRQGNGHYCNSRCIYPVKTCWRERQHTLLDNPRALQQRHLASHSSPSSDQDALVQATPCSAGTSACSAAAQPRRPQQTLRQCYAYSIVFVSSTARRVLQQRRFALYCATRPACYTSVTRTRPRLTNTIRTRSRVVTRVQLVRSSSLTPITRDQFVSPGGRRASAAVREAALTNLLSAGFMSARSSAVTSSKGASCSAAATCSPLWPGACACNAAPII